MKPKTMKNERKFKIWRDKEKVRDRKMLMQVQKQGKKCASVTQKNALVHNGEQLKGSVTLWILEKVGERWKEKIKAKVKKQEFIKIHHN